MVLNKYYVLCDECPMIHAAVVLHPTRKMHYFEVEWEDTHPEWIPLVKDKVRTLWEREYKPNNSVIESSGSDANEVSETSSLLEWGRQPKRRRVQEPRIEDELDSYLSEPRESIPNSAYIDWWMEHRTLYPNLAVMALDAAAIAAMSAEIERVFSR
jgi:hypothetical protein